GLARGIFRHALDFIDHAARLDLGDPVLHATLARAHADLDGLLGDRLVREHADPHLAATLDVAADGAARGLDLTRGQAAVGGGLQAELAERHGIRAPAQAFVTALELLAELGSLGLQHRRYLASRAGRDGRSRSPRTGREQTEERRVEN